MDQPVLQRAPPVHSGGPPCRAAWGAREAAQACQHGSSRDRTMWQLCCLSTLWVSGTSIGGLLRFYNFSGTCCNALRVLQERWHPVLSRTVLQSVSRANLFFECHTTTALVLWQMQPHYLDGSFFGMLLSFADTTKYVADWDHTTDGCISPMKLEACSPASFLCFRWWHDWKPLPGLFASAMSSLSPLLWGLMSVDQWISDRSWQSRGWLLRPWRPMTSWPERTQSFW